MQDSTVIDFGKFRFHEQDQRLLGPAGPVPLGRRAFGVLQTLIEHRGTLVTKEQLFDRVWGGTIVSDSALTSAIKELRRALGDGQGRRGLIETVYGRGYRFVGEVSRIAEVVQVDGAGAAGAPPRPRLPVGEPPMLVVPEFLTVGDQPEERRLAVLLREAILFALARFKPLRIAPSAAPADSPAARAGTRLYRLDVTLAGLVPTTRLFLKLVRARDGSIVWSEQSEMPATGQGEALNALVARIVGIVVPSLDTDLCETAPDQPADLYDRFFRASLRRPRNAAELVGAIAEWEALIEAAPDFQPPYLTLARLLNTDGRYVALGFTGEAERARALALAQTAVELDAANAHGHALLGWCHLWRDEAGKAERHFAEALRLNPFNPVRLAVAATGMMYLGALDEAEAILERIVSQLTAFASDDLLEDQGLLDYLSGRHEEAERRLSLIGSPTISAELFRVVNAEVMGAPAAGELAARWVARVHRCWHDENLPGLEELLAWAARHKPFQQPQVRADFLAAARSALGRGLSGARIDGD